MRKAFALMAAIAAASAGALAIAADSDERVLAFALNVPARLPAAVVEPRGEVCQTRVVSESRFEVVQLVLGTYGRPGPRLTVNVRDAASGHSLARGVLPAGTLDNRSASARVAPAVSSGRRLDVCIRNAGRHRVALYGGLASSDSLSEGRVDGRRLPYDIRLTFYRSTARPVLSLLPHVFERAALFRPPGVGVWTYWALLALVGAGMPLLLAAALRRAEAEPARDATDPG